MAITEPPKLYALLIELWRDDKKNKRWCHVFPWLLILCFAIGFFVASVITIPLARDKANLVAVYAALVTAQGILLALSISSVQQVYLSISTGEFSVFLQDNGLLKGYMFFILYQQAVEISSLIVLIFSLFTVYVSDNINRTYEHVIGYLGGKDSFVICVIGVSIGIFLYSIKQTYDSFTMAQHLVHYKSCFEALSPERRAELLANARRAS